MEQNDNVVNAQVNPEIVINDLLEQVKQLTLQNAMLRALIQQSQKADAKTSTVADSLNN